MAERTCVTCAAWQLHEAAAHHAEERRACTARPMQKRPITVADALARGSLVAALAGQLPPVPVLTRPTNTCARWEARDADQA